MAQKGKQNQWVVRVGEQWGVRGEGNSALTAITRTQKEAIDIATDIAKNNQSDVIIQNRQGQIRDRDSYGNDPNPPKDTKN
ncbi:MAG TPA: DUF2188 domain-containing protein [Aggregatilineaceae bacterium]|nr:DUF2188 domain-containing protein [Aggregatilineaceae bacterium]